MEKEFLNQISHFKIIKVPKYTSLEIQRCALHHLNLKDMGQLRDRMEGQMYYDKLRNDILTEFAFENLLLKSTYDWSKRMNKNYKRKIYPIDGFNIRLITFSDKVYPKISLEHTNLCVFGRATNDSKVYLSGLATKELIKSNSINIRSNIFELKSFESLLKFSTREELINQLESNNIPKVK
ncbi:hypothetical protein [uncultured Aquimarina sp.]|uniref:hypothetical protein n=1 Tax=uncultured Aquimarina sp. TaxID=575652 RepID=UPI002616B2BE|nr:hypothetical protein [uncultured Aquimarina sp.]